MNVLNLKTDKMFSGLNLYFLPLFSGTVLVIVGAVRFGNTPNPDTQRIENGLGELVAGSVLLTIGMLLGCKYNVFFTSIFIRIGF